MLNSLQKACIRHLVAQEFSPPETRMSTVDWCKIANITDRTVYRWKEDAEFADALQAALDELNASPDPFAVCARTFALEQMVAQYIKAEGSEKRQFLKLIIDNTSHVADMSDAVDFSDMDDADLANVLLSRGVTPAGMTQEELLIIARGQRAKTKAADSARQDAPCADDGRDTPGEGELAPAEGVAGDRVEEVSGGPCVFLESLRVDQDEVRGDREVGSVASPRPTPQRLPSGKKRNRRKS